MKKEGKTQEIKCNVAVNECVGKRGEKIAFISIANITKFRPDLHYKQYKKRWKKLYIEININSNNKYMCGSFIRFNFRCNKTLFSRSILLPNYSFICFSFQ